MAFSNNILFGTYNSIVFSSSYISAYISTSSGCVVTFSILIVCFAVPLYTEALSL
ncbi:hypothetical protein OGZ02_15905 [Brachyspira hyodysenteriae]|nr:hypothetical protein [Brachyspira hyodysenteriae]MDA1470260.1 hypothetical protein [Brachyspira hyodysenteriae]